MMTRLEPDAGVILIQTRWHEDDLAGRLLKQQQEEGGDEWHVISLPAIAEAADLSEGETLRRSDADLPISASRPPTVSASLMPARHLAFTTLPPYIPGKTYGELVRERRSRPLRIGRVRDKTPVGVAVALIGRPGVATHRPCNFACLCDGIDEAAAA